MSTPSNTIPTVSYADKGSATAALSLNTRCTLGEGIVWDDLHNKAWFWTDILGCKFYKYSPDEDKVRCMDLPKQLCSFGLTSTKNQFLFAWQDGFQMVEVNHETTSLTELTDPSQGPPVCVPQKTRLNDGRTDRSGRHFICGGFYGDLPDERCQLFDCTWDSPTSTLKHAPIRSNIRVTNSICFSLDNSEMYFADSPTGQIQAFPWGHPPDREFGQLLVSPPKRLVLQLDGAPHQVPDGSCVDADGCVWNACWREDNACGSKVRRIDPMNGQILFEVTMPNNTSQVSCCAFGGPDLDILMITTAAVGRHDEELHAGGIYAIQLKGIKGIPESRFQWKN